jgi:hypothetical protein
MELSEETGRTALASIIELGTGDSDAAEHTERRAGNLDAGRALEDDALDCIAGLDPRAKVKRNRPATCTRSSRCGAARLWAWQREQIGRSGSSAGTRVA